MDKATVLGLLVSIGGIVLGNYMEGGHLESLVQGTAFLIVTTGTFGAVLVSNRAGNLKLGFQLFKESFQDVVVDFDGPIKEILECSRLAKKESVLSLENKLNSLKSPFLRSTLRNVIDGVDANITREIFETQIEKEEDHQMASAKIWSDAGGYSPTIGIIGAVMGLIHVMGNLSDTSKLGAGIAVAFVATIYGVALANLLYLPIATKIKKNITYKTKQKEMILAGALMIGAGINTLIVEQQLKSHKFEN